MWNGLLKEKQCFQQGKSSLHFGIHFQLMYSTINIWKQVRKGCCELISVLLPLGLLRVYTFIISELFFKTSLYISPSCLVLKEIVVKPWHYHWHSTSWMPDRHIWLPEFIVILSRQNASGCSQCCVCALTSVLVGSGGLSLWLCLQKGKCVWDTENACNKHAVRKSC